MLRIDTTLLPKQLQAGSCAQYTSHLFLRNVRCCTSSYREGAESNCKAPPVGAREFHPLFVSSVGTIQRQHARKFEPHSPKNVNRHLWSLDTEQQEKRRREEDWRTEKRSHVLKVYKNRPKHDNLIIPTANVDSVPLRLNLGSLLHLLQSPREIIEVWAQW